MAINEDKLSVLIKDFGFPKSTVFNRVIAKDVLLKQNKLSARDKEMVTRNIKQINWVLLVRTDNTNIHESVSETEVYREIDFIDIVLNDSRNVNKIAESIMSGIPKPLILQLSWYDDKGSWWFTWAVADYKRNKGAENLMHPVNVHLSMPVSVEHKSLFVEKLVFHKQNTLDLGCLYKSILNNIEAYNFELNTGNAIDASKEVSSINNEIKSTELKIARLKKLAKEEKQLNKRMQLIKEVRVLNEKIKKLSSGK